jgi:hypothetical protein
MRLKDPELRSPEAAEWILSGYVRKLLENNAPLTECLERCGDGNPEERRACFTQGQRVLSDLATFHGQIQNGGLEQFFWNCPHLILEIPEALTAVGEGELRTVYEQAVSQLTSQQDLWLALRERSSARPDEFWESFEQSYALLDL